jgi:hypothetical protein
MLQILFACARTGQFVPTGIETDLDTFIALPEVLSLSQCPACSRGFCPPPVLIHGLAVAI